MRNFGFKRVWGGVVVKVAFVVLLLGGAAGVAVGTALVAFNTVSQSVDYAVHQALPQVEVSKEVARLSDQTILAVKQLSAVEDLNGQSAAKEGFNSTIEALEQRSRDLPASMQPDIQSAISEVREEVDSMNGAISSRLQIESDLAEQIQALQLFSRELGTSLTDLKRDAQSQLRAAGSEANTQIQGALGSITGVELARLETVLQIRAELNLALGATLGFLSSDGTQSAELFERLAREAKDRLNEEIAKISGERYFFGRLGPIIETETQIRSALDAPQSAGLVVNTALVEAQAKADEWLLETIKTLREGLQVRADDVGAENRATVRNLLGSEVSRMTDAAELDAVFKQILVDAILLTTVENEQQLEEAMKALDTSMFSMFSKIEWGSAFPEDIKDRLRGLSGLNDPESGIGATQAAYLEAFDVSSNLADRAASATEQIAMLASTVGVDSLGAMTEAGQAVVESATAARELLLQIGSAIAAIAVLALAIAFFFIVRPLRKVTAVTERLSDGDLSPVTGFERTGGEIGRMATALSVFRDGMIERQALEEQERERELAERTAEQRRAEEKLEAERQEAEREAERVAEEQRRETEAREREQAAERLAQQERDARAREQETVVEELAEGMRRLSDGDLAVEITKHFPAGYEGLRLNFNEAVSTLSTVIQRLTESAGNVNASSDELAASADDMAQRTERNAAALEQTSAAVLELDATAKSTSSSAVEVNTVMDDARKQAESSQTTVTNAVSTMSEIEESSSAISKIVDMIEEIAFQTNLLALNAGVEAARAGEEGRGFGVVASEVRALAQRSSEAAAEINGLITSTRNQIERGVAQVGDAGEALNGILGLIGNISEHVSGIASAAQEQSATISEISNAVNGIEEETQRNAAVFEESLAASELLRSEAKTLSGLASKFTTGGSGVSPVSKAA